MAGFITVQGAIAVSDTAQQLPDNPYLNRDFTLTAKTGNTGDIAVVVSIDSDTGTDGTGDGYVLGAGESVVLRNLDDTASVWVSGTSGDVYSGIA